MKKILLLLFCLVSMAITSQTTVLHAGEKDWPVEINQEQPSQSEFKTSQIMSCAASTIFTTGYPLWTNYYSGYIFQLVQ